jgi:hypothetical protein
VEPGVSSFRTVKIEIALAVAAGVMGLLAIVWPEWIELVFGIDPDGGSGALEWGLAAILFTLAVTAGAMAARGARRVRRPADSRPAIDSAS